jgi:gamma-glutamyltranspeptidase/glutathione hydrolase
MTGGFYLNNELTDFSFVPEKDGVAVANRVEGGKRPRSSMAPTIVLSMAADGSKGDFFMATGSPGGSTIPQYVLKTLVGVIDWGLDAQQSSNLIDFGATNSPTTVVGGEHPNVVATNNGANDPLVTGLRALGHTVNLGAQSSGVNSIIRSSDSAGRRVWTGGTDPRREGIVLGDAIAP